MTPSCMSAPGFATLPAAQPQVATQPQVAYPAPSTYPGTLAPQPSAVAGVQGGGPTDDLALRQALQGVVELLQQLIPQLQALQAAQGQAQQGQAAVDTTGGGGVEQSTSGCGCSVMQTPEQTPDKGEEEEEEKGDKGQSPEQTPPPPPPPPPGPAPAGTKIVHPRGGSGINSNFGETEGRVRPHGGTDLQGSMGDEIHAAASGTVVESGWSDSYGNYVTIDHGNGFFTRYAHATENLVNVGDTVAADQVISKVGSTGESTGPHLHFEVHEGSLENRVDPAPFLSGERTF